MHVLLVHNRKAGSGQSEDAVLAPLQAAGHRVTLVRHHGGDVEEALKRPHDLVVAAGGDGTVSHVLEAQSRPRAPVAILALGSANDLARSLGLTPPPGPDALPQIARGWETAARRMYDLGRAEGGFGKKTIVESAGIGGLSLALERAHEEDRGDEDKIAYGRRRAAETLREAPALGPVALDDAPAVEGLVLCEALTVPMMGPRLCLAPDADPGDGMFDVVLADAAGARRLADWIEAGAEGRPPVEARRAKRVVLSAGAALRVDDDFFGGEEETVLTAAAARAEIICGGTA